MRCAKALLFLSLSFASFAILNGQLLRVLNGIGQDIFGLLKERNLAGAYWRPKTAHEPKGNCSSNEVWIECSGQTCPEKSCELHSPRRSYFWKIKHRCICAKGFYRKGAPRRPFTGPCVKKAACEAGKKKGGNQTAQACGTNEEWDACHSSTCPGALCAHLRSKLPPHCTKDCKSGCICALGFYRKGDPDSPFNGPCVKKAVCWLRAGKNKGGNQTAQACGTNEEWDPCHSSSCPGDLCAHVQPEDRRLCTLDCRQGCICARGFFRKGAPGSPIAGPCVTRSECPSPTAGGKLSFRIEVEGKIPNGEKASKNVK